jgi:hypothetical protein
VVSVRLLCFVDDNLFASLVAVYRIHVLKAVELVNAARHAFEHEGVLVSCEDIDPTEEQLEKLCCMRSPACEP